MAAPAQDARGSPLPGVQRRSALGRVQGDNACSESRGEAFGPRHFAGFRRKTESVIVGSYTFAESAVPSSPRAPNETHHTTKERLTIKSQAEMRGKVMKKEIVQKRYSKASIPKDACMSLTILDTMPDLLMVVWE